MTTDKRGVLFVPYHDTLGLLGVKDVFEVCERVYRMHAEGSVVLASPPSFKAATPRSSAITSWTGMFRSRP